MEGRWRKSSFSEGANNCVELCHTGRVFRVRDSKNPAGPVLTLPGEQARAFLDAIR